MLEFVCISHSTRAFLKKNLIKDLRNRYLIFIYLFILFSCTGFESFLHIPISISYSL